MIVIAYDYEDRIISILNSKSVELANAFWQGKSLVPSRIKSSFCIERTKKMIVMAGGGGM